MDIKPLHNQIVHLASTISEADDSSIPILLLKIKDFLQAEMNESKRYIVLLSELWKYDFPGMIVAALQQDFNQISGSWFTASQLSSIVIDCCIGKKTNLESLRKEFIPNLTYTILQLMCMIANNYVNIGKLFKANALDNLASVVRCLQKLIENFVFTSMTVVSCKHFMQLLMMEDEQLSLLCVALLKNILTINRNVLVHVMDSRSHSVVDELAYKISSTESNHVAKVSVSTFSIMIDVHPPLLDLLSSKRYRGFKTYLIKWKKQGFDSSLNRLINILDSQAERQLPSAKLNNAAITIQCAYRGYYIRKKLHRASIAISNFQRLYRRKKRSESVQKEREELRKLSKEYAASVRRKECVRSRTKQLKILENIPAKTVTKFLSDLEIVSAVKIQALWKGWKTRCRMKCYILEMRKFKSAIKIQRKVRRWLQFRRKRRALLSNLIPLGLSDERKVQLQSVIANIRERFPGSSRTDEELHSNHEKAFGMLDAHISSLQKYRRRDEHRKALLAQLSVQTRHMAYLPIHDNIETSDLDKYTSHSTPIMVAARQKHLDMMNNLQQPWWKKLNDDINHVVVRSQYDDSEKLF